ncbi:HD domain-containing protein [Nocardia sp. NPDC020380]|uniref:HD domain-containing protein n=1 Tax=Nocardia sp. NPDC020380 TaxID=3364309 RepID=UPI00379DF017
MNNPVPLTDPLALPDTPLARVALAYVESVSPPAIVHHCLRGYLFARALGAHQGLRPNVDYDDELLFLASALHDLGLTTAGERDQRFEVDGADLAVEVLTAAGLAADRAEILWDAIALHTSARIAARKRPEIALTHHGMEVDLLGRNSDHIPAELGRAIHRAHPRLDIGRVVTDTMTAQVRREPAKAVLFSPAWVLSGAHLDLGPLPADDQLLAACGWTE